MSKANKEINEKQIESFFLRGESRWKAVCLCALELRLLLGQQFDSKKTTCPRGCPEFQALVGAVDAAGSR